MCLPLQLTIGCCLLAIYNSQRWCAYQVSAALGVCAATGLPLLTLAGTVLTLAVLKARSLRTMRILGALRKSRQGAFRNKDTQ